MMYIKKGIKLYNDIQDLKIEEKSIWVSLILFKISAILYEVSKYMKEKENQKKNELITEFNNIVERCLLNNLDYKNAPEMAIELKDFYTNSLLQITLANIKNNFKVVDIVADNYFKMGEVWQEINKKGKNYENRIK